MHDLPDFQDQINPGDPLGGISCTCYAAGMAAQHDSLGRLKPGGREVRGHCRNPDGTPDVTGGTSLPQVDTALRAGWGVDLDTRVGSARVRWAEFARRIDAGQGAILQGGYNVIHPTRFSGSETFTGNHALFVGPGWVVMDPARGRRLGDGLAYASFTRSDPSSWTAGIPPTSGRYHFFVYALANGRIAGRTVDSTSGFRVKSSPPRLVPWPGGPVLHKSIVALSDGTGRHIESRFARSGVSGPMAPEDDDPAEPPADIDESDDAIEILNDDAGA